jgi:hypothetical protein
MGRDRGRTRIVVTDGKIVISGQKVRFKMAGRWFDATVELGSDNRRSLILDFDGAARTSDGGLYLGKLPVYFSDDDGWRDLRGEEIELEWLTG